MLIALRQPPPSRTPAKTKILGKIKILKNKKTLKLTNPQVIKRTKNRKVLRALATSQVLESLKCNNKTTILISGGSMTLAKKIRTKTFRNTPTLKNTLMISKQRNVKVSKWKLSAQIPKKQLLIPLAKKTKRTLATSSGGPRPRTKMKLKRISRLRETRNMSLRAVLGTRLESPLVRVLVLTQVSIV